VQIDQHTEGKTGDEVMREGGEIVERKSLRRTPTATSSVQTTTLKKGNAQEDGLPVEQSSLSGRDREISRSTTRITNAIATTNNQRHNITA